MPRLLRFGPLLLLAALLPLPAHADTLQLANGDSLKGHLIAQDADTIRWYSPILGYLTVTTAQASVRVEAPADPAAPPPPTPSLAKDSSPSTPPAAATGWKTTFDAGLLLQTGRNQRTDTNLRAESIYLGKFHSFRLLGRYLYSETDGVIGTDRSDAAFRWRQEISTRWFFQTNSSYLSAKAKGIDHNIEQNLGLGYRILQTPRTSASIGAGLTGQYRNIHDSPHGRSLFGEVFQDFAFKITPRIDIGQDSSVQYSPSSRGIRVLPNGQVQVIDSDVTNYKITFNTFLRGKLTDTLSLALRYEYEYDNPYEANSQKSEQRVTTSLGYTF